MCEDIKMCYDGWALIIAKWFISIRVCIHLSSVRKTEPPQVIGQ